MNKKVPEIRRAINAELRYRMHEPIPSVGRWLRRVASGYYRYHAVPGNTDRLRAFTRQLRRLWRLNLNRRSQRGHVTWARMLRISARWIPEPRVLHPYPDRRFAANHPR